MTMKRLTALFLTLTILCVSSALAVAAPTDKLEKRMLAQYALSGFYADVTFDIKGEGVEYIDPTTWSLLSLLLPGAAMKYESTILSGNRESTLSLVRNETELARAVILENGESTLFRSDLISDDDIWYSAPASLSAADLIAYARGGNDAAWPSLIGVVFAVMNAPEDWQTRAGVYMNNYLTELGLWMQRFSTVAILPMEDKTTSTEMTCRIPAAEVKRELQSMLSKLYADNALMTLLREVLSADEAAAYLNPSAYPTLAAMIGVLDIEEDVVIIRRFNMQGVATRWSLSLPFTSDTLLSRLSIAADTGAAGETYNIAIAFNPRDDALPGAEVRLTAAQDDEGAYIGDIVFTLPTAREAYTVVEETTYELPYTYYLYCDAPAQTYDSQNDRAERTVDVVLALTPAQGNEGHRHSLTLHADLSSRSSNSTPTRLNASLSLMDLTTESGLTINLSARTAVQWTPETVISAVPAEKVTRLEQMKGDAMTSLMTAWRDHLATALGRILSSAMPYMVVENDSTAP